jgi:hypothetical protein
MTNEQMIHLSMVNSYHVLVGNATMEEIVSSGLGMFCHSLEEKDAMKSIEFMIGYFKNLEMYERCAELKNYIETTFNDDGTYKDLSCECSHPEIEIYETPVKCSLCSLPLRK